MSEHKLYELTAELDMIERLLRDDDIDEQTIRDTMDSLSSPWEEKVIATIQYRKGLESDLAGIHKECVAMKSRQDVLQKKIDWLSGYVLGSMVQRHTDKVHSPFFDVSVKTSPGQVCVEDETAIPAVYRTEVVLEKIRKDAILRDLRAGVEVDGCVLLKPKSLWVK